MKTKHVWLAWRSANEKDFISGWYDAMQINGFRFWPAGRNANETYFICGWPGAEQMKRISLLAGLTQCK